MVNLAHYFLRSITHLPSVYFFLLGEMFVPCDREDEICIKVSQKNLQKAVDKIPALAIENMDPLHLESVEGEMINFKYTFNNSTASGFKDADIRNVKFDLDKLILSFNMTCRDVSISGNYTFTGRLLLLPFEGEGQYNVHAKKYDVTFRGRLRKVYDDQGRVYLMLNGYNYSSEASEEVTYDFANLVSGEKDVSDVILKFANENWKEVADYTQGPVIEACMKKMITNLNQLIQTIPIEEYYLKDADSKDAKK